MFRGAIARSDNNIFLNKNRYYFIKKREKISMKHNLLLYVNKSLSASAQQWRLIKQSPYPEVAYRPAGEKDGK